MIAPPGKLFNKVSTEWSTFSESTRHGQSWGSEQHWVEEGDSGELPPAYPLFPPALSLSSPFLGLQMSEQKGAQSCTMFCCILPAPLGLACVGIHEQLWVKACMPAHSNGSHLGSEDTKGHYGDENKERN